MLGSPLLYFKGMRLLMFQLSGFYYRGFLVFEQDVPIVFIVVPFLGLINFYRTLYCKFWLTRT